MKNFLSALMIFLGLLFVVLFFFYPWLDQVEAKAGFSLNFIILILDKIYISLVGTYLIIFGLVTYFKKIKNQGIIYEETTYLMLFSFLTIFFSYIFNAISSPLIDSKFRVVLFVFQTIARFFNPSLTFDFIISIAWLISVLVTFRFAYKYFIKSSAIP